jgi:hypothetical protein
MDALRRGLVNPSMGRRSSTSACSRTISPRGAYALAWPKDRQRPTRCAGDGDWLESQSRNSVTSALFPIPGSPRMATAAGLAPPAVTRAKASRRLASSSSRPTKACRARSSVSVSAPRSARHATPPHLPFRLDDFLRPEVEGSARRSDRSPTDEDLARLGSLLETRGDVDHVAGYERAPDARRPDHHVAGIDANPKVKRISEQRGQGPPHRQRGVKSPVGVVLLRRGRAEGRHHGVANELLDCPAGVRDLLGHRVVEAVEHRARSFGVLRVGERRRAHEVGEENGRELALLTWALVRDRRAAVRAEPRSRRYSCAARCAEGHVMNFPTARRPFCSVQRPRSRASLGIGIPSTASPAATRQSSKDPARRPRAPREQRRPLSQLPTDLYRRRDEQPAEGGT